ncbi:DUF262 domain-containing protein [Pseudomonas aeruginosa]|uniref:DUF262 domain-containing protein n=1 Tax=Pseudomonas aeruginosa TaxID=287 RepID=UPI002552C465|nr:DUF262 domain-containing protein [Pseudomonas aeruginosa]MDK6706105.1 DUF262 domain-containing protein [Pseudomonas aeruginosa]
MRQESPVRVSTLAFAALLKAGTPLALDSYQRGFVWGPDKLLQLNSDLAEFASQPDNRLPYYIGAVLLHRDVHQSKRFIIDGQQRITALSLLYHRATGKLPVGQALSYSGQSARYIREGMLALQQQEAIAREIIEELRLTVIEVDRSDLAFTFFDTQNNRGVPLGATDLLKAYHLRAIDHADGEGELKNALQKHCAERWEALQRLPAMLSPGQDFAPNLFNRFLWRARRWRGAQTPMCRHETLLTEFQNDTWRQGADSRNSVGSVPLYATRPNRLGVALTLAGDGEYVLQGNQLRISQNPANLPMALRQPIHEGVGFFLYADKYAALLQRLMNAPAPCAQVSAFRTIYRQLLCNNQEYLREIFMLCSLVYVDQFDVEQLTAFALRLEFLLGAIRLKQQLVKQETAANFFRLAELNLLDVIAQSYHPKQVLDFLQKRQYAVASLYAEEAIEVGNGVQGRYKRAVLGFYREQADSGCRSLADKSQWLEAYLRASLEGCHGH